MAKKTVAEIAAIIHSDMCNDDDNGYSWAPRNGGDSPHGSKTLTIDGKKYTYPKGSYDCSSSIIKAWQLAIQYTDYKGKLDGATYTGNMREVFRASGLFDIWDTASTVAQVGDVYLNDANHTGMCVSVVPDLISEFCINENGEVYGGKVGDQTGREAWVHNWYDYPWNVILHYNGKAEASNKAVSTKVKYRVTRNYLNVRSRAMANKESSVVLGYLKKGDVVTLSAVKTNKAGNTWGKIASGEHKGRYIAVKYGGETNAKKQ